MQKNKNKIDSFVKEKGIKPYEESNTYLVFNHTDIFHLIELIMSETNIRILGGDIWKKTDNVFTSTYDSWYCEPTKYTVEQSIKYTLEYLHDYPLAKNHYISLSFQKTDEEK